MVSSNLKHFSNAFFFNSVKLKENFSFFFLINVTPSFFNEISYNSFKLDYFIFLNFFFLINVLLKKKKIFQFFNSQLTTLNLISSLVAAWKKNLNLFFIATLNGSEIELYRDELTFFFFKNSIKKKTISEKYQLALSSFYINNEKISPSLKCDTKKSILTQNDTKLFFQNLNSVFIKPNLYISSLFSKQANFFLRKKKLITVEYAHQVGFGDITEGLPKIEQLLSNFTKKDQTFLGKKNGVFLKNVKEQYFYILSSVPKIFPLVKIKSLAFKKFLAEKTSIFIDKIELDGTIKYLYFGSKILVKNETFLKKILKYFFNKKINLLIYLLNKPNILLLENFFTFPTFFSKKFLYKNLLKNIQLFFKSKKKAIFYLKK